MNVRLVLLAVGLLAAAIAGGCSSDDDPPDGSAVERTEPARTVPVPPERQTPFCEAINELNVRVEEADPGTDTREMIIDTYASIVDEVPAEIRDDFLAVLAQLQAGPTSTVATPATTASPDSTGPPSTVTTTIEDFEEGYTPDDNPALRLNAYIQFACTDSQNNPGPPETQPMTPPPPTT